MYVKKLNGRAAFRSQGDNLMAEFQFQIAPLRKQHGLSQQQLAELVGVSRQTINAIEKGDYNPTIRLCRAICRALGTTLDELFWTEEEEEA